ncbi:MAG: family 20 glycosylhydrolase [Clostridia bacterium]|nr:family 20 glycosylhydrolase [Clostridia bacterium]
MTDIINSIIPKLKTVKENGQFVTLGKLSKADFSLKYERGTELFESAVNRLKKAFEDYSISTFKNDGYEIVLKISPEDPRFEEKGKKEGYIIDIGKDNAEIIGFDDAGAFYGAITFSKLLHQKADNILIPQCFISDYPEFEKRGHFMECRYGSDFMSLDDWKAAVDYLSDMKINTLTLGVYGCWKRQYDGVFAEYQYIPLKKYPNLNTPRDIKYYSVTDRKWIYKHDVLPTIYEKDYFGELISYGKTKNIEIFPLFNSLGHNTLIPRLFPEISAMGEDGEHSSVGFCLSNEKTYEIMFDIYDEIIDRYLIPNGIDSFEIGLDEIADVLGADVSDLNKFVSFKCQCEECRKTDFPNMLVEYIIRIAKHMKQKGIKNLYIYHDMLMHYGLLNETLAGRFKAENVYDIIVIDWWDYWTQRERLFGGDIDGNVNSLFRGIGKCFTGYYHWALPMQCNENIYHIANMAKDRDFEGVIAYSSFEYCYDFNYSVLADCLWNLSVCDDKDTLSRYANAKFPGIATKASNIIEIANDMMSGEEVGGNLCPAYADLSYYPYCYLNRFKEYPQSYPARAYIKIRDNEQRYLPYIKDIYSKAEAVYKFFDENAPSHIGDIWKDNAGVYLALADEFLTIYNLDKRYKNNMCDENEFSKELSRLIAQREKIMHHAEKTRIPANAYTYLRNMSVGLQAMIDLKEYIDSEKKERRKPDIDIFTYENYLSDISWFIR